MITKSTKFTSKLNRCEVSGEAPLFQTAASSNVLVVVGHFHHHYPHDDDDDADDIMEVVIAVMMFLFGADAFELKHRHRRNVTSHFSYSLL